MVRRWRPIRIGLIVLVVAAGCHSTGESPGGAQVVRNTVPASLRVPSSVYRLAVLYPKTHMRALTPAYARLEGAVFQLKELRPYMQIVDRLDLTMVLDEQRLQVGGTVHDESAVRIGRMLGVDSVLLYRIDGPTLRDQMRARFSGQLPALTVTSKLIRVESGEVLFHNVVTAGIPRAGEGGSILLSEERADPALEEAMDRGVLRTIEDLRHAFRE